MNDRTVTISVSSRSASRARFLAAAKGEKQGHFIVFQKASELAKLLTDNRVGILEAMAGKGTLSIRGVAGLVERDVKAVYTDVRALVDAGVLDQKDDGVEFPYSAVHVDFTIQPKLARVAG
jgi:predicted transcriptional regulator